MASISRGVAAVNGARKGARRRAALMAATALVAPGSLLLAGPAAAQTSGSVTGSGSVSPANATGGVAVTNTNNGGTFINGLQVNNTTGSPTVDAYKQTSQFGQSVVIGNTGANVLSTNQSGGAAIDLVGNVSGNLSWGISGNDQASTLNLTGSYGIYAALPGNGFVNIVDLSNAGAGLRNITANGTAVAGIYASSGGGTGLQVGAPTISGFTTGIDGRSSTAATVGVNIVTTGGSIAATTTGINAAETGTGGVSVSSGSAITVAGNSATGINATTMGGAISVTTVTGGTINGGGTGIAINGSTGTNAATLTIGAAIGNVTTPSGFGVNYQALGGNKTTNLIAVNADVSGGGFGIATQSASVGVTIASGATVTGGAYGLIMGGVSSLNNMGTIRTTNTMTAALNSDNATLTAINTGLITGGVGVGYVNGLTLTNGTGGVITGTGGTAIKADFTTSAAANISLLAGSAVNGAITLSNGSDTLQLYNGQGVANGGMQAAASVTGAIDLGGGTNMLILRGQGDGTAANGAAGVLNSAIVNVTTLVKQDSGTWTLSGGNNAYPGGTQVQAGRLVEQNQQAAPGAITIASGATLEYNIANGTVYQTGAMITGAGTLLKTGTSEFRNDGLIALSAGGLIDVQAGRFAGSSDQLGLFTGNQGSLNIGANGFFDGVEGTVIVDKLTGTGRLGGGFGTQGSTTIGIANGSSSFGGTITDGQEGVLKLIKAGTGNISLNAASTYTGGTTINAGQLSAGVVDALGTGAVTDNAALLFQTATATGTIANAIGGSGTLYAQTSPVNGTQTYAGALTGGLALSIGNGFATNVILSNDANTRTGTTTIGANSTLQGTVLSLSSGAITDNGALTFTGASGSYASAISGAGKVIVGVASGGTLTLTGANSYTGGTTINAGSTLGLGNVQAAGTGAVADNGTLAFDGATGAFGNLVSGSGIVTVANSGTGLRFNNAVVNGGGLSLGTAAAATIANSVSNNSTAGAVRVTGANDVLTITANGAVTSTQTAAADVASAIYATGANVVVNNAGVINAPRVVQAGTQPTYGDQGIYLTNGGIVTNTGTINGIASGSASTYRSDGVLTFGDSVVNNTGATYAAGTTYANGTLAGATASGGVIVGGWDGVYVTGNGAVYNSGTIAGNTYQGVDVQGNGLITNYAGGRIIGTGAGAEVDGAGTITNSGLIVAGTYTGRRTPSPAAPAMAWRSAPVRSSTMRARPSSAARMACWPPRARSPTPARSRRAPTTPTARSPTVAASPSRSAAAPSPTRARCRAVARRSIKRMRTARSVWSTPARSAAPGARRTRMTRWWRAASAPLSTPARSPRPISMPCRC